MTKKYPAPHVNPMIKKKVNDLKEFSPFKKHQGRERVENVPETENKKKTTS